MRRRFGRLSRRAATKSSAFQPPRAPAANSGDRLRDPGSAEAGVAPGESRGLVASFSNPNPGAPASRRVFTIPGDDLAPNWDLMYYFEVLAADGSGWFHPDPALAVPYYVVTVNSGGR